MPIGECISLVLQCYDSSYTKKKKKKNPSTFDIKCLKLDYQFFFNWLVGQVQASHCSFTQADKLWCHGVPVHFMKHSDTDGRLLLNGVSAPCPPRFLVHACKNSNPVQ